jgi:hypothetical protein
VTGRPPRARPRPPRTRPPGPQAPYEGREEEGRVVASIRSSIAAALWGSPGISPRLLLDELDRIVARYRELLP